MISVVIPLYNKGHVIVNTLRTVFAQTYKDFEVVIIDDGSTDNGLSLIKEHFNDSRIRIISQSNQGVAVARDRGVRESRYNYIAFLDADDEWHPDYLKIMAEEINKYPAAGLFSSGGLIQDQQGLHYRLCNKYLNYRGKVDFFENPFLFTHTSGTIINKKVFDKTEGSPVGMRCLQDFALFVQIALISDFIYVGIPLSKYVGGVAGQTTSADAEKRYYLLQFVVLFYNILYKKWSETNFRNNNVKLFLKYDLRHRFKGFLRTKNWKSLDYFYANLNAEPLSLLCPLEKFFYRKHYVKLGVLWINLTKLLWRTHKFPVVGADVNIDKINLKYRIW